MCRTYLLFVQLSRKMSTRLQTELKRTHSFDLVDGFGFHSFDDVEQMCEFTTKSSRVKQNLQDAQIAFKMNLAKEREKRIQTIEEIDLNETDNTKNLDGKFPTVEEEHAKKDTTNQQKKYSLRTRRYTVLLSLSILTLIFIYLLI